MILFVLFVLTSTQVLVTRDVLDFNILPFSLQTIIPGLLFFSMGFAWRMHKKRFFPSIKHPVILSMLVVSVLTFFQMDYPNRGMNCGYLPMYPLCIINAYGYIYLLYRFAICMINTSKWVIGRKFIVFCGTNTLNIL